MDALSYLFVVIRFESNYTWNLENESRIAFMSWYTACLVYLMFCLLYDGWAGPIYYVSLVPAFVPKFEFVMHLRRKIPVFFLSIIKEWRDKMGCCNIAFLGLGGGHVLCIHALLLQSNKKNSENLNWIIWKAKWQNKHYIQ